LVRRNQGSKSDKRLENLEWCTPSENVIHSYGNGLQTGLENSKENPLPYRIRLLGSVDKLAATSKENGQSMWILHGSKAAIALLGMSYF
jgi:hypothetical protein